METRSTQQEILLLTGTHFSKRQWYEGLQSDSSNLTGKERLEEACWNGLLYEMLPEISEKAANGKSLPLWQIRHADSFLEVELGESPESNERDYSINPPSFLESKCFN